MKRFLIIFVTVMSCVAIYSALTVEGRVEPQKASGKMSFAQKLNPGGMSAIRDLTR